MLTSAILAFAVVLCSCGKNWAKNTSEVYTVEWFNVCSTVPENVADVEKAANEYLSEKLDGVRLKLNFLDWAQYSERIKVMAAGGEKFDIVHDSGDNFLLNVSKNAYLPLNDLIDKYAPKTKEMLGEEFLSGSSINGVIYGIPANKDKGQYFGIQYRKDLAEKYNLSEELQSVKKYEDLYPVLDKIKELDEDVVPLFEDNNGSTTILLNVEMLAFPAGIYLSKEGGEIVNTVESPEYRRSLEVTWDNRKKGYTKPGYGREDECSFIRFAGLNPIATKEFNATSKYEYEEVAMTESYMRAADTIGSVNAISRTCENPEKALRVLELFNTDKYFNNLIVYGIEGKNYKKTGENTIETIPGSGYGNAGMQWEFGNVFLNYITQGEDENKHQILEDWNKSLKRSPALGFHFNPEKVKTELAACANLQTQYKVMLERGDNEPGPILDEYIKKLRAAGSEKIMEEVKDQYAAWQAGK